MTAVPFTEEDRRTGPFARETLGGEWARRSAAMPFHFTALRIELIDTLLDAGSPRPARG